MSRLTTRSKNKRHRTDEGDDASSEILRRIHLTGEVTQNDFCQLYLINKPVCQGCRVNSRDSPNCFCGLIPPSSGARKSGLWQKLSDLISSLLGSDPCEDHRVPTERPGGLTNVGATCYANSILQCLYMNVSFRAGIFSVEPDLLKQHPVLDQLAQLFAELHSSEKAVIDSAPFVKTLELDKGSQQDSHEFLTLFLSLLEHSLSHSKIPKARTLIQDLFRGSVSHVTRCSLCGKDSEASSKMEDFYGLELNIKGLNNLEESLDDYLSIEQLSGENQYFCQSCGKRVDATHCIKLRALPSVLIFQLKRYDFLMETTKKKKITSSFSFPRQLNLGRRLGDATESELLYDLSAILIHKGAAANSGHYVARIKDENSGQWWEFDDEVVSKLGLQPFGGASSNSSADSQPTLQSEEVHSLSNGNQNATTQKLHLGSNNSQHQEIFSPTDAYMLIYNCIRTKKDGKGSDKMLGANAEHEDAKLVSEHVAILPSHLSEEIEKLNAPYAQECHEYKLKKDKQVAYITERRKEVKSILSEAPVHSVEDPFFWVSTDWLRQWADNVDDPLCLDNSTIQCSHGKVAVNKVSCMKRISASAWSHLVSKYGGGPALSSDDYCIECLKEEARSSVSADDYRGRRASFKQIAEAALAGNCPDGTSYYVSRTWLVQWLRRKNVDSPCDADAGPTASLRCPHGCLLPEQSSGAKRVRVPESLWLFFSESAKAVKPDDLLGCLPFCSDSQPCVACSTELSEVVCHEGNLREVKLRQRQNHEKLFAGKNITLYPGHKYFLVPSSWLTKWRAYVTSTGKNISSSVEPESLEVIINSLKCEKHARLLDRPIGLVCRRGLIAQRSLNAGLTMIPESDWKLFCDEWEVAEEKGITSEIVLTKSITNKLAGSSEEAPILEEDSNPSSDEVVSELEAKDLIIKTDPDICEDCIGERESCELMRKLNYCNEEITVHLIRGKEVPRSLLEASANISELDRRTSKRSRRTSSGKICTLKVSGTTSVYQLKMMIWECFGVVKENQKLHKGPTEIEDDSATLADKNIFPGDVLWVGDSEIHENRDIADELSEPKGELQQAEEGFRGTLLTSSVSFEERHDPAISSQL